MGEKKSNKTPLIISLIALVVVLLGLGAFFILRKPKPVPYVEYQGFVITPATDEYKNKVYTYTTNEDGEPVENLADFEDAYATYKFYDYNVTDAEDSDTKIVSFKYDATVPLILTKKEDFNYKGQWHYTYSISRPVLFDYYTGMEYLLDNSYNLDEEDGEYKYTTLIFGDREYRIGIKQAREIHWAGTTKIDDDSYTDTCYETASISISAPKDFDGLMVGLLKEGANEERFNLTRERRERYEELKTKQDATPDELQELVKMEEENNTPQTLLESRVIPGYVYLKDDFAVFRVDEIKMGE